MIFIFKFSRYLIIMLVLCNCNNKTSEEYFKKGLDYQNKSYPKKAFRLFCKAIRKNSANPDYYINKAEARFFGWETRKGREEKVLADYNEAFKLVPDYLPALKSRLHYYYLTENNQAVVNEANKVILKDSSFIDAYVWGGRAYFKMKDTLNGYKYFNIILSKLDNPAPLLIELAEAEFTRKMYKSSINHYIMALNKSDKVLFSAYFNLCVAYWKIGDKENACHYFKLYGGKDEIMSLSDDLQQMKKNCD